MPISALPTPPSRASSPATFSADADAFLGALPTFRTEANALETNVNSKEVIASAAATTATNQANIATTKASEAATSATNAAASYDQFDDRYLGSKSTDPTLDNDGNTLLIGALYWNTVFNEMRVWGGSSWERLSSSSAASSLISISNKTSAYTVVSGDLGKIINCIDGTFTVSLTSAVTLGAGFNCWIWNTNSLSTNIIIIDPNSSQTIDGLSTLILNCGEGVQIVCDGENWQTGDKKTMRGYAENMPNFSIRPSATGDLSIALGSECTASGTYSFAAGVSCVASGGSSVAIGDNNNAGLSSVSIGTDNICNYSSITIGSGNAAQYRGVAIGNRAVVQTDGKLAYASGSFSSQGQSQTGTTVLRGQTSNANVTPLTSDGSSAGLRNLIKLDTDSTYAFIILVVARARDVNGESAGYKFEGVVDRGLEPATTALVGTVTKTVLAEDTAAWDCNVTVDTVSGSLKVEVTGEVGKTIRWVATCWTSEVTG